MNNGRFAISVHILTLLAKAEGELVPSDYIAGSMNINPVLVRKELASLRNYGLVESKEGKGGGSSLAKPATSIRMSDIYDAVKPGSLLGKNRNEPNPECTVGRQINEHLDSLYAEAEASLLKSLGKKTLADFVRQFH
ncbi:Rrf2 family transcriptional regulator [Chitinophaga sedimenti]|uniref:Rrf2 family transcriptional regulator n=1 Tax=Chitinophaga sedimenti TaxID=2033606 RepID=UPI002005C4EC|nr:Rrf2 family transcriptional regulator [Chitinophaga sedimenti]MCK7555111.1 Rrf2 family transcriptional regulator [Chitinophaga sedimenti]